MAVVRERKKVVKKENTVVLEKGKLKVDEVNLSDGEWASFSIITEPNNYKRENLVVLSSHDGVKVDFDKKKISVDTEDTDEVVLTLKDVVTNKEVDSVTININSNEEVEDEVKEKEENEVKEKTEVKQNKNKGEKKMTEKVVVNRGKKKETKGKVYSEKSLTKEELLDILTNTLVDKEGNPAYKKSELNSILDKIDATRIEALKEGKELFMGTLKFSRKLQKGRVHNPKLETVKSASFVTPHFFMTAKLESDDKENIKGEYKDGNFISNEGKKIDVQKVNDEYQEKFVKKFK